jgi:NDP-sugar pyrophosphorylase family protein
VPRARKFDVPDLVNAMLAESRQVGAWPHDGEWIAIDRMEQLEDAARMLAEKHA